MYFLKMTGILPRILGGAFILGGLTLNAMAMETEKLENGDLSTQSDIEIANPLFVSNEFSSNGDEDSSLSNPLKRSQFVEGQKSEEDSHEDQSSVAKAGWVRDKDIKTLQTENLSLKEKNTKLENENSNLLTEKTNFEIKIVDLETKIFDLNTQAKKDTTMINAQKGKISLLEKQRQYGAPFIAILFSYFLYTLFI